MLLRDQLINDAVAYIDARIDEFWSNVDIARMFNVSRSLVSRIVLGHNWGHLQ